MTHYCELCDKSKKNKSKYNHINSRTHKTLDESFTGRYLILMLVLIKSMK